MNQESSGCRQRAPPRSGVEAGIRNSQLLQGIVVLTNNLTLQSGGRLLLQTFQRHLLSSGRGASWGKKCFLRVSLHYSRVLTSFLFPASGSVSVRNTGSPHRLVGYKVLFKDSMRNTKQMQVFFFFWETYWGIHSNMCHCLQDEWRERVNSLLWVYSNGRVVLRKHGHVSPHLITELELLPISQRKDAT